MKNGSNRTAFLDVSGVVPTAYTDPVLSQVSSVGVVMIEISVLTDAIAIAEHLAVTAASVFSSEAGREPAHLLQGDNIAAHAASPDALLDVIDGLRRFADDARCRLRELLDAPVSGVQTSNPVDLAADEPGDLVVRVVSNPRRGAA